MEVRIPMHSIIDVITNSSTEIFTSASDTGVKYVTELLEKVLKAAGSDKTVDELFDIKFSKTIDYLNSCPLCEDKDEPDTSCPLCKGEEDAEDVDITDLPEDIRTQIENRYEDEQKIKTDIVVIAKTLEGKDIWPSISSLFDAEEKYNY